MNYILYALAFSIGVNLVMFVPAYIKQTDTLTDISYASTFGALVCWLYFTSDVTAPKTILFMLILAWALRLGSFLFIRIRRMKVDHRFDGMRESWPKFLRFWLLQGVSVFIVMLNSMLFLNGDGARELSAIFLFGIVVSISGLVLEGLADSQKSAYYKTGAKLWPDSGLWRRSRHPNYLGEMMMWSGIYIATFGYMGRSEKLAGLISPLYIICLLLFVSGLPMLEKAADKKWGDLKNYKEYKRRTGKILPKIRA
jgi:steroid 5-alpha reductase family enzyme